MMKIKKGDTVKVMIGKDRGKTGKVSQIFPAERKVVVEGANKRYKHMRARREREKGQRIEFWAPMDISNVQAVCPKCNKVTRIGFKILENKNKVRLCRKCKEII